MGAAGLAFRAGRLGFLSVAPAIFQKIPQVLRFLGSGAGLLAEVTAFRGTSHGLAALSGLNTEEDFLSVRGFATNLINFATLKLVGNAFGNQNPLLVHTSQASAMVAGHQLAYGFGFATQAKGSILDQLVHAEVMNLQMGFGAQLIHLSSQGRVAAFERSLDLELQSREETFFPQTLLPRQNQLALAGAAPFIRVLEREAGEEAREQLMLMQANGPGGKAENVLAPGENFVNWVRGLIAAYPEGAKGLSSSEKAPTREDFEFLYVVLQKLLEGKSFTLTLPQQGLEILFTKKGRGLEINLSSAVLENWEDIGPTAQKLIVFGKSSFRSSLRQIQVLYKGADWSPEKAMNVLADVLKIQRIERGQELLLGDEASKAQVKIRREGERFAVEFEKPNEPPQKFYLLPSPISGSFELYPYLKGQAFTYRSYKQYQEALIALANTVLGEHRTKLIIDSHEELQRSAPAQYGPVLRACFLSELVSTVLPVRERAPETFKEVARLIEEAYTHLDFETLLYLRTQLGTEKREAYDREIEAFNQSVLQPPQKLLTLAEMPMDFPLTHAIPREEILRDFFLRHGIFESSRFLQENWLLLREPHAFAMLAFVPAFNNIMAALLGNFSFLKTPEAFFARDPASLDADDLIVRNDILNGFKDLKEFVRILQERQISPYPSFLAQAWSLMSGSYERALRIVPHLPPSLTQELGLQHLPSVEELGRRIGSP